MKIGRVKINNFRSIRDTEFTLSKGVTAIAGGNESGKSNSLLAIHKFLNQEKLSPADKYQLSTELPLIEIEFNSFTPEEIEVISEMFDQTVSNIILARHGDSYVIVSPILPEPEQEDVSESAEHKVTPESKPDEAAQDEESVPPTIIETVTKPTPEEMLNKVLSLIPSSEFIKSVESLIIGENIPIADLYPTEEEKKKISTDRNAQLETVRTMLELGGITEDIVRHPNTNLRVQALQEGAAKIAKRLRDSWNQEDVKMRIFADQDKLVIQFRDGMNIAEESKEDDSQWIWTLPEDRSTGFRWYVTFYVRFLSQLEKSENIIFLIDDAGAPLNKRAQEDLLKEFSKLASPDTNNQIIYVTHSKYMVEWDVRNDIRLAIKERGSGTKIQQFWWSSYSTEELPSPLSELGLTWSDDFLKSDNLIVEGYGDAYLLNRLSRVIASENKQFSLDGFKTLPAGGAPKVIELAILCKAHNRKALLLFDSDEIGLKKNREAQYLVESKKLSSYDLKTIVGDDSKHPIFTIEDLLPKNCYINAFNQAGAKHFGERWETIQQLRNIDKRGIVEAAKARLISIGFNKDEVTTFVRTFKYDFIRDCIDSMTLQDYAEHQLEIVNTFFASLGLKLQELIT